jgi:hypothetical protein
MEWQSEVSDRGTVIFPEFASLSTMGFGAFWGNNPDPGLTSLGAFVYGGL